MCLLLIHFFFLHHQVSGDYICIPKTQLNNPAISTTAKKIWDKIKANSATATQKRFPRHSQQKLVKAGKLWTNLHRESSFGSRQAERVPQLHSTSSSRTHVETAAGDVAAQLLPQVLSPAPVQCSGLRWTLSILVAALMSEWKEFSHLLEELHSSLPSQEETNP